MLLAVFTDINFPILQRCDWVELQGASLHSSVQWYYCDIDQFSNLRNLIFIIKLHTPFDPDRFVTNPLCNTCSGNPKDMPKLQAQLYLYTVTLFSRLLRIAYRLIVDANFMSN